MSPVIHAVRHNGNDANVLVVALAKLKLLLADKLEHPVLRGGRRTEGGRGRGGGSFRWMAGWQEHWERAGCGGRSGVDKKRRGTSQSQAVETKEAL